MPRGIDPIYYAKTYYLAHRDDESEHAYTANKIKVGAKSAAHAWGAGANYLVVRTVMDVDGS